MEIKIEVNHANFDSTTDTLVIKQSEGRPGVAVKIKAPSSEFYIEIDELMRALGAMRRYDGIESSSD